MNDATKTRQDAATWASTFECRYAATRPTITAEATLEQLIAWHEWNDGNGDFELEEGDDPQERHEELWALLVGFHAEEVADAKAAQ